MYISDTLFSGWGIGVRWTQFWHFLDKKLAGFRLEAPICLRWSVSRDPIGCLKPGRHSDTCSSDATFAAALGNFLMGWKLFAIKSVHSTYQSSDLSTWTSGHICSCRRSLGGFTYSSQSSSHEAEDWLQSQVLWLLSQRWRPAESGSLICVSQRSHTEVTGRSASVIHPATSSRDRSQPWMCLLADEWQQADSLWPQQYWPHCDLSSTDLSSTELSLTSAVLTPGVMRETTCWQHLVLTRKFFVSTGS